MKPFTLTAVVIFSLIAVVHLIRLFMGWQAVVNGFAIPVWWSAITFVVAGGLALMLWRESR